MTDKEKIKAEIKKRIVFQKECIKNSYRLTGKPEEEIILEYKQLLSFIDSLPEEPVSDVLEKEMESYFIGMEVQAHENIFEDTFKNIAKHFFELGLKAQKGE